MSSSQVPPDTIISTEFYDLCLYLGGSPDSFTGLLLTLMSKADPGKLAILTSAFPREAAARAMWMEYAPLTYQRMNDLVDVALIVIETYASR